MEITSSILEDVVYLTYTYRLLKVAGIKTALVTEYAVQNKHEKRTYLRVDILLRCVRTQ